MKFVLIGKDGNPKEATPNGLANIGQIKAIICIDNSGNAVQITQDQLKEYLAGDETFEDLTLTGTLQVALTSLFTGAATFSVPSIYSIETGIIAAGTNQATATALTKEVNNVTTCSVNTKGVILMTAVAGKHQIVFNSSANTFHCYPVSGSYIDGVQDTGVVLQIGEMAIFTAIDATHWISNRVYVKAATGGFDIVLAGGGAVGAPSVAVGTANKGLYELSTNQLGVSVAGALATLFDTDGIKTDSVRARVQVGSPGAVTVSAETYGDGKDYTTTLTLTQFKIGTLAGAGAALALGNPVFAFPAGQHFELVYSFSDLVLTALGTPVATDTGLGSVVATGAVNVLSGTATFEDRITGQTINTDVGGGTAMSALTAATAGIGTGISLNVAASVKEVYLNSAGTWNVDNTGDLTASGTIILKWSIMS